MHALIRMDILGMDQSLPVTKTLFTILSALRNLIFSSRTGAGREWVHETSVSTWCSWSTSWSWWAVQWRPLCAFSRTKDRSTNFPKTRWNWQSRRSSLWLVVSPSSWPSSSPWRWRLKLVTPSTSCFWSLWPRTRIGPWSPTTGARTPATRGPPPRCEAPSSRGQCVNISEGLEL